MIIDLNYTCEKLGVAVEYLVCLDKPLRQRLYKAFGSFHVLNPRMMPTKEIREDSESIRNRFYRIPQEEADNPLIASLK